MKIITQTTESGAVKFITVVSGRRYVGRCPGYNIPEARQRFRQYVEDAERKLIKRIIDKCLHCTVTAEQCKGNCKVKQSIKVRRWKGVK